MSKADVTKGTVINDLQALLDEEQPPEIREQEISVSRLAQQTGWSFQRARRMVRKWESEGRLIAIGKRRVSNGHVVQAWKLKK